MLPDRLLLAKLHLSCRDSLCLDSNHHHVASWHSILLLWCIGACSGEHNIQNVASAIHPAAGLSTDDRAIAEPASRDSIRRQRCYRTHRPHLPPLLLDFEVVADRLIVFGCLAEVGRVKVVKEARNVDGARSYLDSGLEGLSPFIPPSATLQFY